MSDRGEHPCDRIHKDSPICELEQYCIALHQLEHFSNDLQTEIDVAFDLQERLLAEEKVAQLGQESIGALRKLLQRFHAEVRQ